MRPRRLSSLLLFTLAAGPALAQGDPDVVARIIDVGKNHSQAWETLEYLAHEIGPRLTGSTRLERACLWALEEMRGYGLHNCHLEKWGEIPVRFDRGASRARMIAPTEREFEFTTRAWSAGTDGPVSGRVLRMPTTEEEYAAVSGDLPGSWILTKGRRRRGRRDETEEEKAARELAESLAQRVREAGILGTIRGSRNDLVITSGSWRDLSMDDLPTDVEIQVRRSDYEAMEELLDEGKEVRVEADLVHFFSDGPVPVYNVVGEIPGTERPDEVIILSGHLDSWDGPGSQGAQDNGTGTSVMLEAARILMEAGARPKRTIRICLWTGEEQGLYGSRAYVESLSEEEKAGISACLVDDGGTNYQGGLVCIESMAPMLDEAIAPVVAAFPEYDIANSVQDHMPRGGASDHASFNRAGIPGFFWIEKGKGGREEKNYNFVHHTQYDTTRYAVPEYLVQSATCSAVVAYNLAQAEGLLPREERNEETDSGVALPVDASFQVLSGGLTGAWKGTLTGDSDGGIGFLLDLQVAKDGRVRGTLSSPVGEGRIKEGSWDAATGSATFKATSDMGPLEMAVKLEGERLTGTIELGGKHTFSAQRLPLQDAPVNGTWSLYLPDFDATATLRLAVGEDGVLRGWFKSQSSDSPLYGGQWNSEKNEVRFEYDYPHAGRLPVTATLKEGTLVGTIGESASFTGKRVPAGEKPAEERSK